MINKSRYVKEINKYLKSGVFPNIIAVVIKKSLKKKHGKDDLKLIFEFLEHHFNLVKKLQK